MSGLTSSEHILLSLGHSEEALLWRKWGLQHHWSPFHVSSIYQSTIFMFQLLWRVILYFEEVEGTPKGRVSYPEWVHSLLAPRGKTMVGDLELDINIFKRLIGWKCQEVLFIFLLKKIEQKKKKKKN